MADNTSTWSMDGICLKLSAGDFDSLADVVYRRVCRTTFDQPGFCLLNAGPKLDSPGFRRLMVELKQALAELHAARTGHALVYLSAARFDQQETTRLHLDGGPEECFLMLGYEPSEVDAELAIADYSKCAFDLGMTPKEFLARHNPMFRAGHELLVPYLTRIPCFSRTNYQIVCINNSYAPFSATDSKWQGTLHTASILLPDENQRRVINSTMIANLPSGSTDAISAGQLEEFQTTAAVHRKGYDKHHLDE
jgi:hypothetical protein